MKRKIINIDCEKCNGCELCISACLEGALQLINGKAVLISESYCDGLGDCLPECPTGAIEIVKREATEYDEALVKERMNKMRDKNEDKLPCGCPSTHTKTFNRENIRVAEKQEINASSNLAQWPVQIRLVQSNAPYFNNSDLLIAADCSAYAYSNIHKFMKNKITLIGCPKLDDVDYADKLTDILTANEINSITVIRMEVPCCGGIVNALKNALQRSGKVIPLNIVTISTDGEILE